MGNTLSLLANRHCCAIKEFSEHEQPPHNMDLALLHDGDVRTGRWRMAGDVLMVETSSSDGFMPAGCRLWVGIGEAGFYQITVAAQEEPYFFVTAKTKDWSGIVWEDALLLMHFSVINSEVGRPIKAIKMSERSSVAASPDAAVRAAMDELRNAQLELAMQAVAACDVSPAYFKVHLDNPWTRAAARWATDLAEWGGDRLRPDFQSWELSHHFGVVAKWRAARQGGPAIRNRPQVLERAARFFSGKLTATGRLRQAGKVTMYEADDTSLSETLACTVWQGQGAESRFYQVETCVDGVGNILIEAVTCQNGGYPEHDAYLHKFVLSEHPSSPHLQPGLCTPASLRFLKRVFTEQLEIAFKEIALEEGAAMAKDAAREARAKQRSASMHSRSSNKTNLH